MYIGLHEEQKMRLGVRNGSAKYIIGPFLVYLTMLSITAV
jgi:hypothetical protein